MAPRSPTPPPDRLPDPDAAEALRDTEERTSRALAATDTALWEVDLDRGEVTWSANLETLVRRPVDRVAIADAIRWVHAADVERVRAAWAAIAANRSATSVEYRIEWPDGTVRRLLSVGRVVDAEDGRPARLVGSTIDVTDRHAVEMHLRQSQKMDAIGRLAGGVAHDFNNLLTVIQGYGQLLAEKAADAKQASDIREVLHATDRASLLTRQLLAFSQQQVIDPAVLDLNEIVKSLMGLMRRLIGAEVDLVIALGDLVGTVRADKGQLGQVVMNLIVNARDAVPRGGRIMVETDQVEVDAPGVFEGISVAAGRYARLRVRDTGTGMSEETKTRIFEPFFTTKDRGKGTGLGLSTVYGIVTQSGGHIRVQSEVGAGSVFEVWLPISEQMTVVPMAGRTASDRAASERVVLVIEDQDAVRSLVRRILEREGFGVLEASESSRAEMLFDEHKAEIALIVTDVGIPGEKGTDLYRRLASKKPELRVIYMSGQVEETVFADEAHSTREHFLAKPFTAAGLIDVVQDALRE
jgi:signal transduction histidine kinase/ActR/RegA family two-component response regulator